MLLVAQVCVHSHCLDWHALFSSHFYFLNSNVWVPLHYLSEAKEGLFLLANALFSCFLPFVGWMIKICYTSLNSTSSMQLGWWRELGVQSVASVLPLPLYTDPKWKRKKQEAHYSLNQFTTAPDLWNDLVIVLMKQCFISHLAGDPFTRI